MNFFPFISNAFFVISAKEKKQQPRSDTKSAADTCIRAPKHYERRDRKNKARHEKNRFIRFAELQRGHKWKLISKNV
jgi:hypothetical protein